MSEREGIKELLDRATRAAQAQKLDEASALLEEAFLAEPDNLRALDLAGFVRFFQGKYGEAEGYCRRALAVEADHAYAHKGLGLCLSKQGKLEEGLAELERAIEQLKPAWLDPYHDLAVVLLQAGKPDEALAAAERGRAAVPARSAEIDKLCQQIERYRAR